MIDYDLSHELHSLAATVDEPVDLAVLHRRISMQSRRRAVTKVGFAGAGVAAVVGGLFVVQEQRQRPVESSPAASSPVASSTPQVAPTALPACDVVLAGLRAAKSTPDTGVPKDAPTDKGASSNGPSADFKGIVTVLTIDGPQLTFRKDEPNVASPTSGTTTVDSATTWVDGPTQLDTPPTLQIGEQLGLATTLGSDGVERALFIDVGASASVDQTPAPDTKIVVPGDTLPPGPTEKSMGRITDVGASSITVALTDRSGQARNAAIDLATTLFYAGDTRCLPGSLTVGTAVGVAFHFGDASTVIADAVMIMP